MNKRVLILGGYGVFGARIAMGLARDSGLTVLVAGRDAGAAARHCREFGGEAVVLDRDMPDLADQLSQLHPDLVIDAAGPFQIYGADPYRLARIALQAGAHYLDLSDDAGFTDGIAALDTLARARGLVALSGVSSVPALSSAAVTTLIPGLSDIHLIDSVLLPGNRAPRGLSVIRAILAQVGKPLTLWRGGRAQPVPGWSGLTRVTLPGLGPRWASFIGAPDLSLFPARFNARSVLFRAGLELSVMHLSLGLLALPVRWGLVRDLTPLARPLRWLANGLHPFGSDRGGMLVRVIGLTPDGKAEQRDWTLIAGAGDGPHVPALPARIVAGAVLGGRIAPGARACLAEFTLNHLAGVIGDLNIVTKTDVTPFPMLFPTVLGNDFDRLPAPVRDLHRVIDQRDWRGRAQVTRGAGLLARLAAGIMRFPPAASDVPVTVSMTRKGEAEVWIRDFAGHRFRSYLRQGRGGALTERFGPLRFRIGLAVKDGRLHYPVVSGTAFGLPIPRALLPQSNSLEAADDQGRATFDVSLSHPVTGLIVRYQGWLVPSA